MKEDIILILGKNHKHPIQFVEVHKHSELYGLYTYKGGVHVIREGMDINFDTLSPNEQEKVVKLVESKKWRVNKALQ